MNYSTSEANTGAECEKAMLELVNTDSDLLIFNDRTGEEVDGIPDHSLEIVLNTAYDDETVAQTIFDHLVDGNMFGLQGEISVTVTDSEGQTETIKFDRAEVQDIYIQVKVAVKNGIPLATVQSEVKNNIMAYIAEPGFDMGSIIYANMFAASIYEADGVAGITQLKISKNNLDWADQIQLSKTQVPNFDSTRIQVYEQS